MNGVLSRVRRFLVSEDGPTAVEYAVMLALIVVVCVTVIQSLGTSISGTFSSVQSSLGGSRDRPDRVTTGVAGGIRPGSRRLSQTFRRDGVVSPGAE